MAEQEKKSDKPRRSFDLSETTYQRGIAAKPSPKASQPAGKQTTPSEGQPESAK